MAIRRITQTEAAARLGISAVYLNRMLNGYAPTTARVRSGLATLLGIAEGRLFAAEDPSRGVTISPGPMENG